MEVCIVMLIILGCVYLLFKDASKKPPELKDSEEKEPTQVLKNKSY